MRLLTLAVGLTLALATVPCDASNAKVVLVPFSNISGSEEAPRVVEELIRKRLESRGWSVVSGMDVEPVLEERRIRYLDSLSAWDRTALLDRFGASTVVLGSILDYRGGGNPFVAVSVRMIERTGRTIWSDAAALSGAAAEGVLGLGRPANEKSLASEVTARLGAIPRPGAATGAESGTARLFGRPRTYRSADHPKGEVLRVCIVPFASRDALAARIVNDLLSARLPSGGELEVIEPAELREAMRAEGIRSVAEMSSDELTRVGKRLGTTFFLRGNVHVWREAPGGRSEIHFDMNLADVSSGSILWAVSHQRRGIDYSGLLQRGTVESAVALSDRAISEAVKAYRNAPLRSLKKER